MQYRVVFEPFAERYFIKSFAKKYPGAWERTRKALELEFSFVDHLFDKTIAEHIHVSPDGNRAICKTEFKIAGTQESRHGSGNRCIIALYSNEGLVRILLVYSKTDVKGSHETNWWEQTIKGSYPELRDLLP
jgi:hypothetical protein